jgi:hypothetical protein
MRHPGSEAQSILPLPLFHLAFGSRREQAPFHGSVIKKQLISELHNSEAFVKPGAVLGSKPA